MPQWAKNNIKAERTSARSALYFSLCPHPRWMLSPPNANMLLSQIDHCLYLKLAARTYAGFVSCRASCLSPSRYGELRQENKTSKDADNRAKDVQETKETT